MSTKQVVLIYSYMGMSFYWPFRVLRVLVYFYDIKSEY